MTMPPQQLLRLHAGGAAVDNYCASQSYPVVATQLLPGCCSVLQQHRAAA